MNACRRQYLFSQQSPYQKCFKTLDNKFVLEKKSATVIPRVIDKVFNKEGLGAISYNGHSIAATTPICSKMDPQ